MEEKKKVVPQAWLDRLGWWSAGVLFVAGLIANYYFSSYAWSLRFIVGLFLAAGILGCIYITSQGKKFLLFIQAASLELRKVVWPNREETFKTTAVVAVLVFVASILLWLIDLFLIWVISWFTR